MPKPISPKQAAYLFFLKHADYSYDPKTETPKAGRSRCARQLAKAERDAAALGFEFRWEDDPFECLNPEGPAESHEWCACIDAAGNCVASLGCIDDATREYRRVVEAELASEALAQL